MTPNRRSFLTGFGAVALAHLLSREQARSGDALSPRPSHFPAKAKAVIWLFMQGGPSHLDTFDPKPLLKKLDGKPLPSSFNPAGLPLQFMKASDGKLMASPFAFRRCGQSGLEV
jgi:hypothetical protein